MYRQKLSPCFLIAAAAILVSGGLAYFCQPAAAAQRSDGQLTIIVVDRETKQPVAARLHLTNSRGRPVTLRIPNTAEFGGHLYVDGRLTLPLRLGQYTFEIDAGPEYRLLTGHFEIERHADDTKQLEVKRVADLNKENWFAGDLDVARPTVDLPLIMRAEALSISPTRDDVSGRTSRQPTRKARQPRTPTRREPDAPTNNLTARLLLLPGGDLLLFRLQPPASNPPILHDSSTATQRPATGSWINEVDPNERVVARVPYTWDVPVWLASGRLDAMQIIHHHALREGVLDNEQDGRPRDPVKFPGRSGNGRWSEAIYYHALNCGLRIAPAAGSGSGSNDNPVGTNRVYVHCDGGFTTDRWWAGLAAGRVVVTNGPLLRPMVEGRPPGYVFRMDKDGRLALEIGLDLATRVPVDYLQIIKNGDVEIEIRLADWAKQQGRLPPLHFDASGWFLVRAVTNNAQNYQLASSGPYYLEQAGRPRISRRSVTFFLEWIDANTSRLHELTALDESTRKALLAEQESARQFFQDLLSQANAD